jgi:polysaccharide biosynthesis protein PslH
MRILFLSRWYPHPPSNGSKLRINNLLRGLATQHVVTLLSFADESMDNPNSPELHAICKEVRIVPWKPYDPSSFRARLNLFSTIPRSLQDTYSVQMQQQVEQALSQERFDLVIASQWGMSLYSNHFQGVPAIFEEAELGVLYDVFARASSARQRLRYGLMWAKQQSYTKRILRNFRACTVVSEAEKQLMQAVAPDYANIAVIPNCINLADYQASEKQIRPNSLIFTGSFRYFANYDAMVWFVEGIFPRIKAKISDAQLTITGDHANQPLPPAVDVTLTGFVDDIRSLIASSWTSIVPLRIGGGTRLKILEAMALGTPVITTSKGAEGLAAVDGEHLMIADSPDEFARKTILLLEDDQLRQQLAFNAYQFVKRDYDCPQVLGRFLKLVESAAQA